jgi:hypothetical protein
MRGPACALARRGRCFCSLPIRRAPAAS